MLPKYAVSRCMQLHSQELCRTSIVFSSFRIKTERIYELTSFFNHCRYVDFFYTRATLTIHRASKSGAKSQHRESSVSGRVLVLVLGFSAFSVCIHLSVDLPTREQLPVQITNAKHESNAKRLHISYKPSITPLQLGYPSRPRFHVNLDYTYTAQMAVRIASGGVRICVRTFNVDSKHAYCATTLLNLSNGGFRVRSCGAAIPMQIQTRLVTEKIAVFFSLFLSLFLCLSGPSPK